MPPAEWPRALLQAVTEADDGSSRNELVRTVLRSGLASAAVWFRREGERLEPAAIEPAIPHGLDAGRLREAAGIVAAEACRRGEVRQAVLTGDARCLVAAPLFRRGALPEALVLLVERAQAAAAGQLAVLAATHGTLADALADCRQVGQTVRSTAAMLEILERVEQASDVRSACEEVADQLQLYFQCGRVAVGVVVRGRCRLQALSGISRFDAHSELSLAIEAALDETLLRGISSVCPPAQADSQHALRAHRRLLQVSESGSLLSVPLRTAEGEVVAVCILMDARKDAFGAQVQRFLSTLAPHAGQSLDLLRWARRAAVWRRCRTWLRGRRAALLAIAAVLLLALMAMPCTYHVRCDCELQPVTRRYVPAPYDAKLAKALVGPGDVVQSEQVLAEVDGREMRWELESVLVELDRAGKKYDAALAKQSASEAQLARLEVQRLELRRHLLEQRMAHLEIKSPLAGVVLSGDLERTEGAPLKAGETLFEIAPLEAMLVELAVPESEIAHVREGDQASLLLDAYPRQRWHGVVQKVHPRAEVRNNESVFVAEVALANPQALLRPGMKGQARIAGRTRPLVWNWFHRPWEALVKAAHGL